MLGPILFNIIINDIFDTYEDINGVSYAYDLQITMSDSTNNIGNMNHIAEHFLNKLKKLYGNNGLLVNNENTQLIFLGTPQMIKIIPEDFSLSFNDSNIYTSKQVTNLGVIPTPP